MIDQAEEDDDGARVDEQVVDDQPPEHPHHHEEDADDVVGHREPEGALAAADAPVAALLTGLHAGLHPDGRWHGGSGRSRDGVPPPEAAQMCNRGDAEAR